jgi:hypothetical protein
MIMICTKYERITINVVVVFMAGCVIVFRGPTSLRLSWDGVGPVNQDILLPEMARAKLVSFCPKKFKIFTF